ncbi:hypothetical protein ALC53_13093 [Atta colombica]|uniref:Uncharacterized protein n=1 Tax=Atta colombica TaxID=520822 RepID=A0A151HYC1_9HYME|nr:hypothetical protein ALC53_13093 [Atta colombica]
MRPARVPTEYSDRVEEAQHGWLPTHSDGGGAAPKQYGEGATSQQSVEAYQQFSGGAIPPGLWVHVRLLRLDQNERWWPDESIPMIEIPELKRNICLIITSNDFNIIDKFFFYNKLYRIVVQSLRFWPIAISFGLLCAK